MNNCSICGWGVAWCVDKEDKGTYWLCGRCAVEDVTDMIKEKRVLVRVGRAADGFVSYDGQDIYYGTPKQGMELIEALKEAEEGHLLD
jgi:hypothetical protein